MRTPLLPLLPLLLLLLLLPIAHASKYLYKPSLNVLDLVFDTASFPSNGPLPQILDHVPPHAPLIIKFYAPWCGHCRHFKNTWESVGATFKETAVTVAAVSCDVHGKVCSDRGVKGYPSLKAFNVPVGEEFQMQTIKKRKLPDMITELVELYKLDSAPEAITWDGKSEAPKLTPEAALASKSSSLSNNVKSDLYRDALKSIFFTLYHTMFPMTLLDWGGGSAKGIYADHKHSKGFEGVHTVWGLKGWLDMILNTIPGGDIPDSDVLAEFRSSVKFVLKGVEKQIEEKDAGILNTETEWKNFILGKGPITFGVAPSNLWSGVYSENDPLNIIWSERCQQPQNGFTCGVWFLNHITSLGVAERYGEKFGRGGGNEDPKVYLDSRGLVGGEQYGEVIRSFVSRFFPCETCQLNFLRDYDDCEFRRCEVVHDTPVEKKGAGYESSKGAAVWMWEVHNSVTLRVKGEEGFQASVWPSPGACPKCYKNGDESHFDKDAVYEFLADYYYRTFKVSTVKQDLLASNKLYAEIEEIQGGGWWKTSFFILAMVAAVILLCRFGFMGKLKKKKRRN